jgi:hypothetical protein
MAAGAGDRGCRVFSRAFRPSLCPSVHEGRRAGPPLRASQSRNSVEGFSGGVPETGVGRCRRRKAQALSSYLSLYVTLWRGDRDWATMLKYKKTTSLAEERANSRGGVTETGVGRFRTEGLGSIELYVTLCHPLSGRQRFDPTLNRLLCVAWKPKQNLNSFFSFSSSVSLEVPTET